MDMLQNKVDLLMMQKRKGQLQRQKSSERGEKDYDPEMDIGTILHLCDLCQHLHNLEVDRKKADV